MFNRMFGGLLFGIGGWLQRSKAQRATTSLLPPDHPEHRNASVKRARHRLAHPAMQDNRDSKP